MIFVSKPPKIDLVLPNITKVFLAGSIEMGSAIDWQDSLVELAKEYDLSHSFTKDICFFNPRRNEWDSSWVQSIDNEKFNEQVIWELDRLFESDYIFMHFEPNTKSPITLLEFGLYARSKKLIVHCPKGFWRKGNVDIVCARYQIPQVDTIEKFLNYLE